MVYLKGINVLINIIEEIVIFLIEEGERRLFLFEIGKNKL